MLAKQKILIVDDDNNIAELISLYLTKECFDCMIVNDGEEAINAFETFSQKIDFSADGSGLAHLHLSGTGAFQTGAADDWFIHQHQIGYGGFQAHDSGLDKKISAAVRQCADGSFQVHADDFYRVSDMKIGCFHRTA